MRDVVYDMEVTLEELCKGGSKKVRIWSEGQPNGGRHTENMARDIEIDLRSDMHTVRKPSPI